MANTTPQRWPDRLLDATGIESAEDARLKLAAISRLLLVAVAVESWESLPYWAGQSSHALHVAKACALSAAAAAAFWAPAIRIAVVVGALLLGYDIAASLPDTANHHYFELVCLALIALAAPAVAGERVLVLQGLRWLAALGLFWAGLQKLLYGYWFNGELLAYLVSRNERFAALFAPLLSSDQLIHLQGIRFGPGAGPYRVDAVWFVAASNLTWIGELLLPPALFVPRLRRTALAAVTAYIVCIELGAREIFFGGVMLGLVVLFARARTVRWVHGALIAFYLYALIMIAGLLPRWLFT